MIKEFINNLDVVATSPMAFVAYILVLLVWAYITVKNRKLKFIEGVIHTLNYEDKIKAIENELDISPSSNTTPEQWLKHRRIKYILTAFIASLVMLSITIAIHAGVNTPSKNNFSKLSDDEIIEKTRKFTNDYFLSLASKSFNAETYFSPHIERFFSMKGTTRKAIQHNIETEYYPDFKNATITPIPNTWEVINKYDDSCMVTFEAFQSWYSVPEKRSISLKALYLAKFDKYLRFYYFHSIKIIEDSRHR